MFILLAVYKFESSAIHSSSSLSSLLSLFYFILLSESVLAQCNTHSKSFAFFRIHKFLFHCNTDCLVSYYKEVKNVVSVPKAENGFYSKFSYLIIITILSQEESVCVCVYIYIRHFILQETFQKFSKYLVLVSKKIVRSLDERYFTHFIQLYLCLDKFVLPN